MLKLARFEQQERWLLKLISTRGFMDTEPTPEGPNFSVNPHRRTTQLNLWMIGAVVLFFILGAWYIARVAHRPPASTQEMKQGLNVDADHWAASLC